MHVMGPVFGVLGMIAVLATFVGTIWGLAVYEEKRNAVRTAAAVVGGQDGEHSDGN